MLDSTFFTIATGLIGLNFGWWAYLQRIAKPELTESAGRWLRGKYDQSAVSEWRDHLILNFDNTFGIEPFSWSFIRKSLKVTFVTTLAVYLSAFSIAVLVSDLPLSKIFSNMAPEGLSSKEMMLLAGIIGAFVYNAIPDFLSLCETRFVLTYLHRVVGPKRILGYLFIDLFLSTGIFVVWLALVAATLHWLMPKWTFESSSHLEVFIMSSFMFGALLGVISNYLSSGWIWFYGLAGLFSRAIDRAFRGAPTRLAEKYLSLETKPFDYLALLTSCILGVALLGVYILLRSFGVLRVAA